MENNKNPDDVRRPLISFSARGTPVVCVQKLFYKSIIGAFNDTIIVINSLLFVFIKA